MSCNPCLDAKQINACADVLVIGTGAFNTAYDVYIQSSTGRVELYPVTSDGAGLLILNTAGITFPEGSSFELWVTLADAPMTARELITYQQGAGTIATKCITFTSISVIKAGCVFTADENIIDVIAEP